MPIPCARLSIIIISIAVVAAVESVFLMLLVATVTGLGPLGRGLPFTAKMQEIDPVLGGGLLLVTIAFLRIGLSRAIMIAAGRARRSMEKALALAAMGTSLRNLERRSHFQAESVIADIERISTFVSELRGFVPSAISAATLLLALIWLSPLLSSVLAVVIVAFIGTMRFRFRTIGLRDSRLAEHRDGYLLASRDALSAARELRLGANIRQSLSERFTALAARDGAADAGESFRLGLYESLGFVLIAGFALGLAWATTERHVEAGVAGAYAMLILLLLPALMTTAALYARCAEVIQADARLRSLLAALPIAEPMPPMSNPPAKLAFRGLMPEPDQGTWRGDALDFDLLAGNVVYIVGGNGAGKTTTLKAIAGLYPLLAGNVVGTWPSGATENADDAMRQQLFAGVFAEGNVPLPTRISEALKAAIDMVGLSRKVPLDHESSVSRLSYGERRRVDLALALAEDRPFLILDESTANQSVEFKDYFFSVVVPKLTSAGKGLVIATHDVPQLTENTYVIRLDPNAPAAVRHTAAANELRERLA